MHHLKFQILTALGLKIIFLRETWGSSSVWHKYGINFNIKLVFILGLDVIGRHYNVQTESEKFQDILQIDFIEGFGIRNNFFFLLGLV